MNVRTRSGLPSANIVRVTAGLVAFTIVMVIGSPAVWAVILAGNTTVTSIGHSFQPPRVDPILGPLPGVVTDFLISQSQNVGGGALLPSLSLNLELDTAVSYRIQAPEGKRFQVSIPPAALSSAFSGELRWNTTTLPFESGEGHGTSQTFENLAGTGPIIGDFDGAVGDANGWFEFSPHSPSVHTFGFSAVTYQSPYSARSFGDGVLSYAPTSDSHLLFSYTTNSLTDPGRFVTIVPEPSSLVLLGAAGLGLLTQIRRRRRV